MPSLHTVCNENFEQNDVYLLKRAILARRAVSCSLVIRRRTIFDLGPRAGATRARRMPRAGAGLPRYVLPTLRGGKRVGGPILSLGR